MDRCGEVYAERREKAVDVVRSTDDVMFILYRRRGWTQADIANLYDCNISTVSRHIQAAAEARGEVVCGLYYNIGTEDKPVLLKNRALFTELYVKQGKGISEIADLIMCSKTAVARRLKKYGIKTRPPGNPNFPKKDLHRK